MAKSLETDLSLALTECEELQEMIISICDRMVYDPEGDPRGQEIGIRSSVLGAAATINAGLISLESILRQHLEHVAPKDKEKGSKAGDLLEMKTPEGKPN